MMRSALVACAAARFFQAPAPGSVPVSSPAATYAVPYASPVSYGFDQASAFPSVPVAAAPVQVPVSGASSNRVLSLAAGAALGATVAVLFSSGKKSAPKAAAKGKPAAKKPVAKKPVAKKPVAKPVARPAARKPVAKAAPVRKSSGRSPVGKGGILPWVTNEPGTYAKPIMLSSINFLGDDGDDWVGWGFMPNSVKALYNPNGAKGLFGGCKTPSKR